MAGRRSVAHDVTPPPLAPWTVYAVAIYALVLAGATTYEIGIGADPRGPWQPDDALIRGLAACAVVMIAGAATFTLASAKHPKMPHMITATVAGRRALVTRIRREQAALMIVITLGGTVATALLTIGGAEADIAAANGTGPASDSGPWVMVVLLGVLSMACAGVLVIAAGSFAGRRVSFIAIAEHGIIYQSDFTFTLTSWDEIEERPAPAFRDGFAWRSVASAPVGAVSGGKRKRARGGSAFVFTDTDIGYVARAITYYSNHPGARASIGDPASTAMMNGYHTN